VDRQDRVRRAAYPAAVDHFLCAPLHLGIAALHGREVELGRARPARHRRRRAATEPDTQRRAAEDDDERSFAQRRFLHVLGQHVAETARDHDRLVIAARDVARSRFSLLEGAEIAEDVGTTDLVVEGRRAYRTLEHDVERRRDAVGLVRVAFPGLLVARNAQVRDGEAGQSRLRLGAASRRAFVADLATRAGSRTGKGRDRRRVIVRLHFHHDVRIGPVRRVLAVDRPRKEAHGGAAGDDRGVVAIGREHARGIARVGVADHVEQRAAARLAIHDPLGVEDLVSAMLGVRLREHEQLGVRWIALDGAKALEEIVDLGVAEREPELDVRARERCTPIAAERDASSARRRRVPEQGLCVSRVVHDALGHAIVQCTRDGLELAHAERPATGERIGHAPLDPLDHVETADVNDVGGLARPRRDRAEARHDDERRTRRDGARARTVAQQRLEALQLGRRERPARLDEVQIVARERRDAGTDATDRLQAALHAKARQRRATGKGQESRAGSFVVHSESAHDNGNRTGVRAASRDPVYAGVSRWGRTAR
jgi:hypothetical protein